MSKTVAPKADPAKPLVVSRQGRLQPGTVVFESVTKRFRKHTALKRSYTTLKTSLLQRFMPQKPERGGVIQALRRINIHIEPGQALGVIGKNGSGKSTLLKLIAGIYHPDRGSVNVVGKISALIELGAGFHPDFTGRENVYLGGVMFGLTKREIDKRFDDIVRFAELEEFIDDPVRTYSSGMYMRLGFSLAVHTDPDILLVDEVLAVGDASFIHRCKDRISDFKRRGKTLIFVTHDLESVVRWCDEVIWLDRGRVKDRGEPRRVVDSYLEFVETAEKRTLEEENLAALSQLEESEESSEADDESDPSEHTDAELHRWGNRDVEIAQVRMVGANTEDKWLFQSDDEIGVIVEYRIHRPIEDLVFGIGVLRADGTVVVGTNTAIEDVTVPLPDFSQLSQITKDGEQFLSQPVVGEYRFTMRRTGLVDNSYFMDVAAHKGDGAPYDYHHLLHKFSVRTARPFQGIFHPESRWDFKPRYEVVAPVIVQKREVGGGR